MRGHQFNFSIPVDTPNDELTLCRNSNTSDFEEQQDKDFTNSLEQDGLYLACFSDVEHTFLNVSSRVKTDSMALIW